MARSVGINLNVNNACNWACVYCQVPNLKRDRRRQYSLAQLEDELRHFLRDATTGDFLKERPAGKTRRLVDIAFSRNGEPTSATEFAETVDCAERVLREYDLLNLKLRLITNGNLMHRPQVQQGIATDRPIGWRGLVQNRSRIGNRDRTDQWRFA